MTGAHEGQELPGAAPIRAGGAGDWRIFRGNGESHDGVSRLPPPPQWRSFDGEPLVAPSLGDDLRAERRLGAIEPGRVYRAGEDELDLVNAAIYLRRPLLVTGKAGTGKSTLAYGIAHELRLGPVLTWPITSRSSLRDGLYQYDAIGRLQEASLHRASSADRSSPEPDIGRYIRLGPLGTALLPQARPRVLLIDELDKSDIDLPNDLLNTFEEGEFDILELVRLPDDQPVVEVMTADGADRVPVQRGRVRCHAFPIIIITSNGERAFPPAFLRRCLRLDLRPPSPERLASIVAAHLGETALASSAMLIERFMERREHGDLATDQLLNAIYLATSGARPPEGGWERLLDAVLRTLDVAGSQ